MATSSNKSKLSDRYKPTGLEEKMRDYVYDRYEAMRSSQERQKAEKVLQKGREQWEALRKEKSEDDWQSNHYVPLTTAVIETALSEIIDQSLRPLILPRGSEDISKAVIVSKIYDYTWEVGDADLEWEDAVHDALIGPIGILQEYFHRDIRKLKTKLKTGSKQEYEEEDMVVFDEPYLECVKFEDFFVDEFARSFRGPYAAGDCIRRYIIDIEDFKQFFKGETWDPLGNAKYVEPGGDTNYYEKYKPPTGYDMKNKVEVIWYWSIKPEDWLMILANDVMIVMGPNPYKHKELPFIRVVDVKRTHSFYGKGEAELLESIQDEVNTIRRMVIDRNHLDIDKMFYGTSLVNISDEDLIARPHGFIPAEGEIKPVEYNDVPRSVEVSLQHLEDDATVTTGINPRAQALPTTGTATEAAILKESTLKRIRLKVRRFEREALTRIARLRVSNILQFYPQPKLEKIIGEEATKQFKQELEQLKAKGIIETENLTKVNGEVFKKNPREIRLESQEFKPNVEGQFELRQSSKPFTFFPLKPEYYLPAKGAYDIKFAAGSTLPISKPLLQTKKGEMFDRLLPLAAQGVYDLKKLGDNLLRANDENPADYSPDQQKEEDSEQRLTMALELANVENNLMMKGQVIPATEYAPVAHTAVHIEFTKSKSFQALPANDPRVQVFTDHITGELFAQSGRQSQTGNGEVNRAMPLSGSLEGGNRQISEMFPDKIQGGEQVRRSSPAI